jgi:hypothetical protein
VACVVGVTAISAAAWWVWFSRDVSHRLWTSDAVKEQAVEALQMQMIIERLDAGETDRARAILNQRLDGQILILDAMLKDTPTDETHVWVVKALARIGRHRAEHPSPPSGQPKDLALVQQEVHRVLEAALAASPTLTVQEPEVPENP